MKYLVGSLAGTCTGQSDGVHAEYVGDDKIRRCLFCSETEYPIIKNRNGDECVSDLPLCMQEGWNPNTPGLEMRRRLLDAAQKAFDEGDLDERDRLLEMLED